MLKKNHKTDQVDVVAASIDVHSVENRIIRDHWITELEINKVSIIFKADAGSVVNIIPIKLFLKLGLKFDDFSTDNTQLNSYTRQNFNVLERED